MAGKTAKEKQAERDAALRAEGAAEARAEIEGRQAAELGPDHDIKGAVSQATADLNLRSATRPDQVPDAHGALAAPQASGAKVIVACKIGLPYVDIQLSKLTTKFQQNMQGGRDVKEAERYGPVVRLRGTAYPRGTPPAGFPGPPEVVDGAALNRGIDKDWFDEWLGQNRLNPLVANGFIFAHEREDHVRGRAADAKGTLSGLEPVNPKGDPRIPKSSRPSEVAEVEPGRRDAGA